jgi:hypothetical protein
MSTEFAGMSVDNPENKPSRCSGKSVGKERGDPER